MARLLLGPAIGAVWQNFTEFQVTDVFAGLQLMQMEMLMQQVQQASRTPDHSPARRAPLLDDESSLLVGSSIAQLKMAVTELFKAVSCALRDERDAAEQFVQQAASLLNDEALLQDFAAPRTPPGSAKAATRSGLAPWQIRKVRMHLEANLSAKISTQDLATIAGLSPFHFSRAFRDSFGDSPHRYLLRRRIEHSQGLMLTTKASLADIALECGLVDQAHFGKLFRRLVGESPGMWRRARANQDPVAPPPAALTPPPQQTPAGGTDAQFPPSRHLYSAARAKPSIKTHNLAQSTIRSHL